MSVRIFYNMDRIGQVYNYGMLGGNELGVIVRKGDKGLQWDNDIVNRFRRKGLQCDIVRIKLSIWI